MAAKGVVCALLLSWGAITVGALSLTEEPLRDHPTKAALPLAISGVNWKKEAPAVTLQLCTDDDIPLGQAILTWGETGGGSTESVEENGDDGDLKCSTFQMGLLFTLRANPTFYQLVIEDANGAGSPAVGSITFAMTARTYLLSCGALRVTKLSWTAASPINYGGPCIASVNPFETDCYLPQSFSNTNLCFLVNDGAVTVCLNGPIDIEVPTNDQLSVSYLAYGPPESLLLDFASQDMANLRAIVRFAGDLAVPDTPEPATVYECPGGLCSLAAGSVPLYGAYQVCGEARDGDGNPVQTALTTIIDLKVTPFLGGENVVEIVFAHGRASKEYSATLYAEPPPDGLATPLDTISIICDVAVGHACFGFFSNDATAPLYIALSETGVETDKIIATYTPTAIL